LALLHALPPGHYHIELDLTELPIPLIVRGPLPDFTIDPSVTVPPIVIPLYPRPIRLFDPNNPQRNRQREEGRRGGGTQ
jgi:hypothetical protein